MNLRKRVLTGSRPSGSPHLGNYFGAFKPAIDLGREHELFFFLADFHATNELPNRTKMWSDSIDLAATMLACGLNPESACFFAQSTVPEVAELAWFLACIAPFGQMQRSVAYKDAVAKGVDVNMGIFNYPVLMAADILLYDADLVPVGKDQKQHLELARDLALRFNHVYGEHLLVIPTPLIAEEVAVVPGLDGEKMSKSKDNVVSIFADDKTWKKQIMAIKTSSEGLGDPKNPDTCTVFQLYRLLARGPEDIALMADRYRAGGYGFGHAKLELLQRVIDVFGPMRQKYDAWKSRPDDVRDVLQAGGKKARHIATEKLNVIQQAIGLLGRPIKT